MLLITLSVANAASLVTAPASGDLVVWADQVLEQMGADLTAARAIEDACAAERARSIERLIEVAGRARAALPAETHSTIPKLEAAALKTRWLAEEAETCALPAAQPQLVAVDMDSRRRGKVRRSKTKAVPKWMTRDVAGHALDTDVAAFSWTRSRLEAGSLPAPTEVSVDSFVDYFADAYDYGTAEPDPRDPFRVEVEATPAPWDASRVLFSVGVSTEQPDGPRRPAHLTFLVDTSPAMFASRGLDDVRKSIAAMLNLMAPYDTVAIVTYGGISQTVLPPTPAAERARILATLPGLDGGSPATGLVDAYALAAMSAAPGDANHVVLCTGGEWVDVRSIPTRGNAGVKLQVLGFGDAHAQAPALERLADRGAGNYYFVDDIDEARRVFRTALAPTPATVADEVRLEVVWDELAVTDVRAYGDADPTRLMSLQAGHTATMLFEARIASGAPELGNVRLRSRDPASGHLMDRAFVIAASDIRPLEIASADLKIAAAAASFARDLQAGSELDGTEALAIQAAEAHPGSAELLRMVQRARTVREGVSSAE